MRVMTMDGGFRGLRGRCGLGDLTSTRNAAAAWFTERLGPFELALDRVQQSREEGLLGQADATRLLDRYAAISDRIGAHMAALDRFTQESSVTSWRATSEAILRDVNAWVVDVRRIIGDERGGRVLRTVLLVGGAATLFGGLAYVIWRAS